ncbi:YaaR family protein [Bacillus massiliigorillae]|uniref:YaaR family protein n=1 Tax=Bacillus massiliigorillae TaxID=1243664 RepID=UPI0003A2D2C2|nr:YaaR family protein [Bacillus massiliigorillae]
MKINQDIPVKLDKVPKEPKSSTPGNVRFSAVVHKQDQKMQFEALNKLLVSIEGAGERLERSRTFKDLAKYKTLVKKFVKEAVNFGMELKQSQSWNQYGQTRKLKTVNTIDEKLVELTDQVINKEKDSITILGQIGEIKGLLINLYT